MKSSQLRKLLEEFEENEGDQEIFITASGYYCDETTIAPSYPELISIGYQRGEVWSIGHSHQSY